MTTSCPPTNRLFFSAAERSGDTHAANVVGALKRLRPELECEGFGGELMAAQGCLIHEDLVAVSTMGLGFLRHLGRYVRVLRKFYRCLIERTPSAVVLVDSPGLNFCLARLARWRKVPVIYYICPQIWAWAPWRRSKVLRYTDLLLVILPFEEELYRNPLVPVRFVGHPLADSLRQIPPSVGLELRRRLRISPEERVIGILPGSREQEVTQLMPVLREIINGMNLDPKGHRLLISSFREGFRGSIEQLLWGCRVPHEVLLEDARAITAASDLVLVASGTASLEVAYFEKPMLVLYGVSRLTRFGYDLLAVTPFFSLPNILGARLFGGEPLVRERLCLGSEAPELARAAKSLLEPGAVRQEALDRLREFNARTFQPGASRRAAEAILEFIDSPRI
jgi:lipid-A-disaccharide synthase